MQIAGSIPPMVTPVDAHGDVDTDALQSYTSFLLDGGVDGLFPCGTTGEFSSLTRTVRRTVIETVVEETDGTPVYAGCGGTNVEDVCDLVSDAATAGADAAVVVTPYYLNASQEGLERFYTAVADRADLPLVLYEIPAFSGQRLAVETVVSLADHDSIVAIKSSAGDLLKFAELVRSTPASFDVLQGTAELALASLDVGGDGVVAGPANVYPEVVGGIVSSHAAGDSEGAVALMNEVILPILSAVQSTAPIPALKYLLGLRGVPVGDPLAPLPTLDAAQRQSLEAAHDRAMTAAFD